MTTPDCSHSGICTECGVCGDEFGENIVAQVPPIPVFEGHYEPDGRRTQRLRFRFTKDGKESFIGHLDMLRLLERAARRGPSPGPVATRHIRLADLASRSLAPLVPTVTLVHCEQTGKGRSGQALGGGARRCRCP